jgi:hypothetical protein
MRTEFCGGCRQSTVECFEGGKCWAGRARTELAIARSEVRIIKFGRTWLDLAWPSTLLHLMVAKAKVTFWTTVSVLCWPLPY